MLLRGLRNRKTSLSTKWYNPNNHQFGRDVTAYPANIPTQTKDQLFKDVAQTSDRNTAMKPNEDGDCQLLFNRAHGQTRHRYGECVVTSYSSTSHLNMKTVMDTLK